MSATLVAVMVAVPTVRVLITPVALTVATPVAELFHVTWVLLEFCTLAVSG